MEPSRFRQRLDYADPAAFRSNRYRGMNSMFSGDIYFSGHSHFLRLIKKKKNVCMFQIIMDLAAVATLMIIMALM